MTVVDFKAYHFETNESATKLFNSDGDAKGRLHFFDYLGPLGEDRYGVAAEEVDANTELSCWDWKYFLHKHCDDQNVMKTYKINKASFQKRFDVSDEKMELLLNSSGVAIPGQLSAIIDEKAAKVQDWESKQQGPKSAFTRNFIESLIKAEINPAPYQALIFSEADQVDTNWDKDALVISYKDKESVLSRTSIPPSRILDVDLDRFEELQEGRPLSEEEISKIIDHRRTLQDWLRIKTKPRGPYLGSIWTFSNKESKQKAFNHLPTQGIPNDFLQNLLPNSLMIINNDDKTFDWIYIRASGSVEIKEKANRAQFLPSRLTNLIVTSELIKWVNTYW